jgi:two-component system, LytTR family, response regulator
MEVTILPVDTTEPEPAYEDARAGREPLKRLLIRGGGRAFFLSTKSIRWMEADGHFMTLHLADQSHKIRTSLCALYERLDHQQFLRINRGTIVNVDFILEMRPRSGSRYDVLLRDGNVLSLSRFYSDRLQQAGVVYGTSEA